jgi:diphthamide biosynthesis protein 7
MEIETLHTIDTVYSADSVEWCPVPGLQDHFVCGTYQLDKETDSKDNRKGTLLLFKYDHSENILNKLDTVHTQAILDQKWHPTDTLLALANSIGEVQTYSLQDGQMTLQDKIHVDSEENGLLALALDWSKDGRKILVSDSKGCLSILDVSATGSRPINRFSSHSYEAWTCTFDKSNENIIYSGEKEPCINI